MNDLTDKMMRPQSINPKKTERKENDVFLTVNDILSTQFNSLNP